MDVAALALACPVWPAHTPKDPLDAVSGVTHNCLACSGLGMNLFFPYIGSGFVLCWGRVACGKRSFPQTHRAYYRNNYR